MDDDTTNEKGTRQTRLDLSHDARAYLGERAMREGRSISAVASEVIEAAAKAKAEQAKGAA